jgi:hypothetical protein
MRGLLSTAIPAALSRVPGRLVKESSAGLASRGRLQG